jgi:hypothetical protein
MMSWRLHFGWGVVTVVAVAVTWRAASRPEPAPVPRRISASVPLEPPSPPAAPDPAASDTVPVSAVIAAQAPKAAGPVSAVEKLRAMMKSDESWNDFQQIIKGVDDRSLKLMLAKEAFASGNSNAASWFLNELWMMKGRDAAELVEAYLQAHLDGDEGATASSVLGAIGDPASITALLEALRSKNEGVQLAAAGALKLLGYAAPSEQMIAAFARQLESPDGGMRRRAVEKIAELDAVAGVPVFTRALKDSNGDVRSAALSGLMSSGTVENPQLIEPLLHDPHPEVARQAREIVDQFKRQEK